VKNEWSSTSTLPLCLHGVDSDRFSICIHAICLSDLTGLSPGIVRIYINVALEVFLAATGAMTGCPSSVVSLSFGMICRREAKPQLALGFPLLINSISLNVITFACHVLDQQVMLPNRAELMRSFLASRGPSEGLVAPCGVCY